MSSVVVDLIQVVVPIIVVTALVGSKSAVVTLVIEVELLIKMFLLGPSISIKGPTLKVASS